MSADDKFTESSSECLTALWKEYRDSFESEDDFHRAVAVWPICPRCGKRRAVCCPYCKRVDNLFPPADAEYWDGVDETPGRFTESGSSSSDSRRTCGHGVSCGCATDSSPDLVHPRTDNLPTFSENASPTLTGNGVAPQSSDASSDQNTVWQFSWAQQNDADKRCCSSADDASYTMKTYSVSTPNYHRSEMTTLDMMPAKRTVADGLSSKFRELGLPLVLCTTCDEPFVPKYLPVCKDCGFAFEEGVASIDGGYVSESDDPYENVSNVRLLLMMTGLVVIFALILILLFYAMK